EGGDGRGGSPRRRPGNPSARTRMLRRLTAALALTALTAPAARGDDWPQWMGPQRDGVWRETGILEKFPEGGPKVLWRVPVRGGGAPGLPRRGHRHAGLVA